MLWDPAYTWFVGAITIMVAIGILNGLLTVIGLGFGSVLDGLLPDLDFSFDTPDIDHTFAAKCLGWLNFGKVPAIIALIVFCTSFGMVGILLQQMADGVIRMTLPTIIAVPAAIFAAIPFTRVVNGGIAKVIPKEVTSAVTTTTLIGRVAKVTMGTATSKLAAEAVVRDEHGHSHNIFVKPFDEEVEINRDSSVILVEEVDTGVFKAEVNTNPLLVD